MTTLMKCLVEYSEIFLINKETHMDKNDVEYLRLLHQHLERAYKELEILKQKTDLKILEIEQVEELVDVMERRRKNSKKDT